MIVSYEQKKRIFKGMAREIVAEVFFFIVYVFSHTLFRRYGVWNGEILGRYMIPPFSGEGDIIT